ncbi:hypothetical protein [Siccirubricoccus phaeus]|uniref:hypothetical protein n=1 Tax=Siccirubricoccus phaeus TaxID=2595053 RepID=UPI0011F37EFB|nr:hypothetical protein [Siccirubricoccus phaeus]
MAPRHLLLCLSLLLAACAEGGVDKFGLPARATGRDGDTGAGGVPGTATAAVTAFLHLCGRLEGAEVESRARTYGFVPLDPSRVPAAAAPVPGSRVMARPQGAPAVLVWTEAGPGCELAVGGVDPAALTSAFDTMLQGLGQRPELVVNSSLPLPPDQGGELRLQRAAVVAPRALVPAPPRLIFLRTASGGRTIQGVLTVRVMLPGAPPDGGFGAPATPPPSLGAPKG